MSRTQIGQQIAGLVQNTADIGQHHQLLCLQHRRQLGGNHISVDVVALVVFTKSDRADDRDESIVLQCLDNAWINADDISHLANVVFLAGVLVVDHLEFLGANHAAISPGQTDRLATSLIDQPDDVLLHLASQNPLDHFHGLRIGNTHALDKFALLAQALEGGLNLRAAPVYHDGVDAHQL